MQDLFERLDYRSRGKPLGSGGGVYFTRKDEEESRNWEFEIRGVFGFIMRNIGERRYEIQLRSGNRFADNHFLR